jgi:hypothetical protein
VLSPYLRLAGLARPVVAITAALLIATPASAQFGGLKKKIKATTVHQGMARGGRAASKIPTETTAPDSHGGTIALTAEVVSQLLAGLKAGQSERAVAAREDTPYGRFKTAEAAYVVAQPRCETAKETFPQRAAGKPKTVDKLNALNQKSLAAQTKHDYKLMQIYQDSAMAMIDASCIVKKPAQPRGLYQTEREIDVRAEQQEAKASGLSAGELAMVKERAVAILQGNTPPGDASPMEKAAVSAKAAELKRLLGWPSEQPPAPVGESEPATAAAPEVASTSEVDPQLSAAASKLGSCMAKNMQSHQTEIQALAKRAKAAQTAQNTDKLMAIAAEMQQIQMAGCR